MAADLRQALAGLDARPGAVLAGMYASADQPRCDVENRLLTNLGQRASRRAWPVSGSSAASVCPAPAPVPVARAHGAPVLLPVPADGTWQSWEPAGLLARWYRVTSLAWPDNSPTTRASPGGAPEGDLPPPGQLAAAVTTGLESVLFGLGVLDDFRE